MSFTLPSLIKKIYSINPYYTNHVNILGLLNNYKGIDWKEHRSYQFHLSLYKDSEVSLSLLNIYGKNR